MPHRVELHPCAQEDLNVLDGSVRKEVAKKIDALMENPFLGKPLGNKAGVDLSGFYKVYVQKKKYRIVYRFIGNYLEIVEIVAIGKRDKEEVYKMVFKRLRKFLKR